MIDHPPPNPPPPFPRRSNSLDSLGATALAGYLSSLNALASLDIRFYHY